jgi:hypothetical protein
MENSEEGKTENKNSIGNENNDKLGDFADSNYYKVEENSKNDSSSSKMRANSYSKKLENLSLVKSN